MIGCLVRGLVARNFRNTEQKLNFKPALLTRDILAGVGITGLVPAVSFNVAIEQHERDIIVVALIKLSRALNNKHIEDALTGKRKLILKQLTMRGKIGWDDQIPISNQRGDGSVGWSKIIPEGTRGPSSTVVYYTCSHCKKVVPNSMKDF